MSFNVIVQTNISEKNRIDKTIADVATLSGVLREQCDLIDPAIMIEADIATLANVNYFTIADFGRAYFLTGLESIRNNLVILNGHVDVLSTYATEIKAQHAIIRRQQNMFNLYLNDGSLKCYQNPYILTEPFPAGFTNPSFVLAVAGG